MKVPDRFVSPPIHLADFRRSRRSPALCLAFMGLAVLFCSAQSDAPSTSTAVRPGSAGEPEAPAVPPQASAPAAPDIPELRAKADAGDAASQLALADLIFSGAVKDAAPEEAAALLEKASDSGHPQAQVAFARLLQVGGAGVTPDPERAVFLIQQAAEGGDAAAQTAYAALLMSQIDLKARDVSFDEPLHWFRLAADQGDPEATCRLGMMRAIGQGAEPDPVAGWKLISRAARAGYPLALNEAGICLQKGRGVEADPIAAVGYFHAGADLGSAVAMVNLGVCYRNGNGVPQDPKKALTLFERAAAANFGAGHFLLGEMLERGEGAPADRVAACVHYARGAAAGFAAAVERFESLISSLSDSQRKTVAEATGKASGPEKEGSARE